MGNKNIGDAIKNRRKELGINQAHLSELTGVSVNTLSIIEQGEGNPTLDVLKKILDVLGLEIWLRSKIQ
jgi:y4mF family transcriptional regulator